MKRLQREVIWSRSSERSVAEPAISSQSALGIKGYSHYSVVARSLYRQYDLQPQMQMLSKSFPLNCILLCKSGPRSYCHALNRISINWSHFIFFHCLTNAAWQSLMGFSDAHHRFLSDHFLSPNIWVLSYSDLLPYPSGTCFASTQWNDNGLFYFVYFVFIVVVDLVGLVVVRFVCGFLFFLLLGIAEISKYMLI